jgi:hypothetical protein
MRFNKSSWRSGAPMAMLCLSAWAGPVYSALIVHGPGTAAPEQNITLSIELDATLSAAIDELGLTLEFDPAVLTNPVAGPGSLLASSSFTANSATGTAVASLLATAADLGPGTLASWTFTIPITAVRGEQIFVRARLETFIIDSQPTANLSSDVLTITIVPEPSFYAFLVLGAMMLVVLRGLPRVDTASHRGRT